MNRNYSLEDILYLKQNYSIMDKSTILSTVIGHSWVSIMNKANKIGLNRPNIRNAKLKILLENNLINCYWWGFIMADGYISNKGVLRIILSKKDKNHLQKIATYINSEVKVYNSSKSLVCLDAMDKINGITLKNKLNIIGQKTYNPPKSFNFLNTPDELLSFFIGFIDGDGSIQYNNKKIFKSIRIVVHHNWYNFFINFCNSLEINCGFKCSVNNTNFRKNTSVYLGKKDNEIKITNFIINNNLPVLKRKWKNVY